MSNGMRDLLKKVKKQVVTEEAARAWEKREEQIQDRDDESFVRNAHLPKTRRSRVVSDSVFLSPLPSLRDATPSARSRLLIRKLRLCCYVFDFSDHDNPAEIKRREIKRSALLELVNYLTVFKPNFTEEELKEIFEMLSSNLFRPLPPSTFDLVGIYNPEEDEPQSEPTWPHLQVVYEFLLRLASSKETDAKLMDKYFSREFIASLLQLFDSEDPRERDYLKTIVHRIYGNFMGLRPFIRRAINNVLYSYIYETDRHNGIAELLEILGSIINGFALPLKEQHKVFLQRVLLPLHKVSHIGVFHPQLSYCVTQFLEKDATLSPKIVNALLKYWPATCSKKELMFLTEMEEILDRVQPLHLGAAQVPLFRQVAKSINSPHFQVSEKAIYVLNNDVILRFITNSRESLIPILARALYANTHLHRMLSAMGKLEVVSAGAATPHAAPAAGVPHTPQGRERAGAGAAGGAGAAPAAGEAGAALARGPSVEYKIDKAAKLACKKPAKAVGVEGVEVEQRWQELGHWNESIVELTADILKLFTELDAVLMSRCNKDYDAGIVTKLDARAKRQSGWVVLEKSSPPPLLSPSPSPSAASASSPPSPSLSLSSSPPGSSPALSLSSSASASSSSSSASSSAPSAPSASAPSSTPPEESPVAE